MNRRRFQACHTHKRNGGIHTKQIEEIQQYFDERKGIASFTTLPIILDPSNNAIKSDQYCRHIINIHSNRIGILQDAAGVEYFDFSVSTMTTMLGYYLITTKFVTIDFLIESVDAAYNKTKSQTLYTNEV